MFQHLGRDLPSSIVVFLVALPLCLGIALASGAAPIAGLIAGIIGGIIVAPISGSHVGVSGPAAGLAVIVYDGIQEVGFEAFLLAVVIGGLAQLVLGIARAGIIGKYFPASVIQGLPPLASSSSSNKSLTDSATREPKARPRQTKCLTLLGDNLAFAAHSHDRHCGLSWHPVVVGDVVHGQLQSLVGLSGRCARRRGGSPLDQKWRWRIDCQTIGQCAHRSCGKRH